MGDFPITGRLVDLGLTKATRPPSPVRATRSCYSLSERDWRRGQSPVRAFSSRQYSTWKVFSQEGSSNRFTTFVNKFAVRAFLDTPRAANGGASRARAFDRPAHPDLAFRC